MRQRATIKNENTKIWMWEAARDLGLYEVFWNYVKQASLKITSCECHFAVIGTKPTYFVMALPFVCSAIIAQ